MALEAGVVKEQVDEELVAVDLNAMLAANKGEPGTEFQQQPRDVPNQSAFDVAFVCFVA